MQDFIYIIGGILFASAAFISMLFTYSAQTTGIDISHSRQWKQGKQICEETIPRNQQCGYTLTFAPIED